MPANHDPGASTARARIASLQDAAAQPIPSGSGGWIRVGTASWTDPTMTAGGVFYPAGADTAEERLQYYAAQFPVVEVDATYYALPALRTSELWVERTPPDFIFNIKAHALMTGQPTETKRLPKAIRDTLPEAVRAKPRIYAKDIPAEPLDAVWAAFRDGLAPLVESRAAIEEAAERLAPWRCAVEFRNGSWLNEKNAERTLRFLSDHDLAFVMVDEPQGFKSSVPPTIAVTSPDLAIVRFHGRNADTWEARGISPAERFRYLYDRDELSTWVPRVREAATKARETFVLMNNCFSNYATTNAREIAALLNDLQLPEDEPLRSR